MTDDRTDHRGTDESVYPGIGNPTTVEINGITVGIEHFGDETAPPVLLVGGTTMLSWPDALCTELAGRAPRRALRPARLRRIHDSGPGRSCLHAARPRR